MSKQRLVEVGTVALIAAIIATAIWAAIVTAERVGAESLPAQVASVGIALFHDLDEDEIWDEGEPYLPDLMVRCNGDYAYADENGIAFFFDFFPGQTVHCQVSDYYGGSHWVSDMITFQHEPGAGWALAVINLEVTLSLPFVF